MNEPAAKLTVRVEFPDGVRDHPAYYNSSAFGRGLRDWSRSEALQLVPCEHPRWEFRKRLGPSVEWVAHDRF